MVCFALNCKYIDKSIATLLRSNNCKFFTTIEFSIWKRWSWQCSVFVLAWYAQTSWICQNWLFTKFTQRWNIGLEILVQKSNCHYNQSGSTSIIGYSITQRKIWFLQFQIRLGSSLFWSCMRTKVSPDKTENSSVLAARKAIWIVLLMP